MHDFFYSVMYTPELLFPALKQGNAPNPCMFQPDGSE